MARKSEPPVPLTDEVNLMYVTRETICFDANSKVVTLSAKQNIKVVGGLQSDGGLSRFQLYIDPIPGQEPKTRMLWVDPKDFQESIVSPKQKGEKSKKLN